MNTPASAWPSGSRGGSTALGLWRPRRMPCHKGVPEHVRCDNGPEMIAKALREWLARLGTKPLYIEPGSPWDNGYCESFNGKLQDECLKREIFYSVREAQAVISAWRDHS